MVRQPTPTSKPPAPPLSFYAFLTSKQFLGLELSPAIAAIADASEGREVDLDPETCLAVFGCYADKLPTVARRTVAVRAGGRGGKTSRLLAPKALHAAWTVPLPTLRPGERARAPIVAPDRDLANQALDFVRGYAEESPVLSRALRPSPKSVVTLRRADGKEVDIVVGAATRGGKALRGRTLVGAFLDEAAFFYAADGYTVTDKELYRAAIQRVVPGGQIWIASTPWIAEEGILEERLKVDYGRHELCLCATAPTRLLNPTWDPDGSIEANMRADDPENADREILAIPLTAGTSAFFDPAAIARAFELLPFLGAPAGVGHGADFGFTSDCTGAAATRKQAPAPGTAAETWDTFDAFERRPVKGQPLKPSEAVGACAAWVADTGGKAVAADGHYKESIKEHLGGIQFVPAPEGPDGKVSTYTAARSAMSEGRWRCSIADPALRERFRTQLRSITRKPLTGGGIQISAPRRGTKGGGHGDIVSGWVLSMWRAGAGKPVRKPGASRVLACGSSRQLPRRVSVDPPRRPAFAEDPEASAPIVSE